MSTLTIPVGTTIALHWRREHTEEVEATHLQIHHEDEAEDRDDERFDFDPPIQHTTTNEVDGLWVRERLVDIEWKGATFRVELPIGFVIHQPTEPTPTPSRPGNLALTVLDLPPDLEPASPSEHKSSRLAALSILQGVAYTYSGAECPSSALLEYMQGCCARLQDDADLILIGSKALAKEAAWIFLSHLDYQYLHIGRSNVWAESAGSCVPIHINSALLTINQLRLAETSKFHLECKAHHPTSQVGRVGRWKCRVTSNSDPDVYYQVEMNDEGEGIKCSCRGFTYRNTCRHVQHSHHRAFFAARQLLLERGQTIPTIRQLWDDARAETGSLGEACVQFSSLVGLVPTVK